MNSWDAVAPRKVFLAGAPSVISRVRSVLAAEGLTATSLEDSDPAGVWTARLRREIAEADFVIALLDPPKNAVQTFYELGLAEGMGKPILLVVSPETRLPVDLTGHVVIRPGDDLPRAVSYAVQQWLRGRERTGSEPSPASHAERLDRPLGELADVLRERVPHTAEEAATSGVDFDAVIRDALAASAEVAVAMPQVGSGADVGVWSDALASSVGNPLLVELMLHLDSAEAVRHLRDRLTAVLSQSTARAALLVYGGAGGDRVLAELAALPPTVLAISADRLLEGLRDRPLSNVVAELQAERRTRET